MKRFGPVLVALLLAAAGRVAAASPASAETAPAAGIAAKAAGAAPKAAPPKHPPPKSAGFTDLDRARLLAQASALPDLADRLALVSEPFLNAPYGLSPLGEGEGPDPDPRLRWDSVDCLTFVETAIAASVAATPERLLPVLDDLRYEQLPASFARRNHFVEAQWIPNNLKKGWIREVSRVVGGDRTTVVQKTFGRDRWQARKKLKDLPLEEAAVPSGTWRFEMVPLAVAQERLAAFRPGWLLFVVRRDFYTQPTRVTHVGLVVEKRGLKFLRHASKAPYHRVVDEPLETFLARNAKYDKWPVEGVALFEVRVPEARLVALGPAGDTIPAAGRR